MPQDWIRKQFRKVTALFSLKSHGWVNSHLSFCHTGQFEHCVAVKLVTKVVLVREKEVRHQSQIESAFLERQFRQFTGNVPLPALLFIIGQKSLHGAAAKF